MRVFRPFRHRHPQRSLIATALLAWLMVSSAMADDWHELFKSDLGKCESIPANAYETGLLFNPAGRRTYFQRSRCLQGVAIKWRDAQLCDRVRQRRSLFFSGDAISESACQEAVAEQLVDDRERAESVATEGFHRVIGAHLERPHYLGGDFLFRIETEGSHPGSYQIRIDALRASSASMIDDYRTPMGSNGHSLVRSIRPHQISQALPDEGMDHVVKFRITLELPPRSHTDQFVLALIPIENRRSAFDITVDLSQL